MASVSAAKPDLNATPPRVAQSFTLELNVRQAPADAPSNLELSAASRLRAS